MTLVLSRLLLNPLSRHVRRDIGSVVQLHRTVMRAFPATAAEARRTYGVLFRLDLDERRGRVAVLVQSQCEPDWSSLPAGYLVESDDANPAVKSLEGLESHLSGGREFTFRLRANPTRRVSTEMTSQRVELRGDPARVAWLRRKGEAGGFLLCCDDSGIGILVQEESKTGGHHDRGKGSGRITVRPVLFQGRLRITDAGRFMQTLRAGVGPAKAYGCGLLSLAP
jgi:CRISPR system Cascade subunit CasE